MPKIGRAEDATVMEVADVLGNPFRDRARRIRRSASVAVSERRRVELDRGADVFTRIADAYEAGYRTGLRAPREVMVDGQDRQD